MKIVVVYSGGLDSSVLLYYLKAEGHDLKAISFDYGQKHSREIGSAAAICSRCDVNVEHRIIDLSCLKPILKSALTEDSIEIHDGHYEEETMKATVVPNRNMIFLSLATAWAISLDFEAVAYAAHRGDHAIYPDCRKEFADNLAYAIHFCDWKEIQLLRPFVLRDKAWIASRGKALGVPLESTWSCYKGSSVHCGKCGTCVERREAFELAGVEDPTEYQED